MQTSSFNTSKTSVKHPQNRVLSSAFKPSSNFFESDKILKSLLQKALSKDAFDYMSDKWLELGKEAATRMDELSLLADKNPPELVKRNRLGETINEIRFHPAYHTLMNIAIQSEMFKVKWQPDLKEQFKQETHLLGFISFFLYTMSEGGIPCPLCMTDGVARLIDRYCTQEDQDRLLKHIYTTDLEYFYTGAMFLTEKAGGSDVGANLVSATHWQDDYYLLNGEKWFCSNANAEIIFALARTNPDIKGTKGLSIFLVEKKKPDGSPNEIDVVRIKDKLGVRSMASAECIFTDTIGKLIGKEGEGFKIMTDMINLSRLYNATASLAQMRRALIEAYQFLKYRNTFGQQAIHHAMIRAKLTELSSIYLANFYMTWHAVKVLDKADNGDEKAAQLLRLLTPMLKKTAAEAGVYVIRESMELMGGLGYIEDGVMPKLMRDTMVLPIWEGAGNIMVLDMLRASLKSEGLHEMIAQIKENTTQHTHLQEDLKSILTITNQIPQLEKDTLELTARFLFEKMSQLYQIALLEEYKDEENKAWLQPAIDFLSKKLKQENLSIQSPLNLETVEQMIAWDI